MSLLFEQVYNPDILNCLANLSNDEVFTPPEVVNNILDMLPQELFRSPDTTFLDPACKTGVFLREIAKRLLEGLKDIIPNEDERRKHIFTKQLFGIAITEMTSLLSRRSLYCSKYANTIYSIVPFDSVEGNIRFKNTKHYWEGSKCGFCGATKSQYDRDNSLEQYAYEFIHTNKPEEFWNMKFDVIIGNPPYNLEDGGSGRSAKPIYQYFVNQAIKLQPRYLSMIIPSRWFTGGKGLSDFRSSMLKDKRIRKLVDYENFKDVFPGVDLAGGASYFLWDRDDPGQCEVSNVGAEQTQIATRDLDEYDIFIRQNLALDIIRKILSKTDNLPKLSERISSRKPFGLPTNYLPKDKGVPCWFIQRIGLRYANRNDLSDAGNYLNKWKLLIPKAPIAGQTDFTKPVGFYYDGNVRIAEPGQCCTESWLVACAFDTKEEVESFKSYLFTKVVRFLLLQTVVSQDVTKKNFIFVPDMVTYDTTFTDADLCRKWKISDNEWEYINSRITSVIT